MSLSGILWCVSVSLRASSPLLLWPYLWSMICWVIMEPVIFLSIIFFVALSFNEHIAWILFGVILSYTSFPCLKPFNWILGGLLNIWLISSVPEVLNVVYYSVNVFSFVSCQLFYYPISSLPYIAWNFFVQFWYTIFVVGMLLCEFT